MKCEECLGLLGAHFDGELGPAESAAVSAHVAACEGCARECESLRDEHALYLRYGCDATESPSFWGEVLARAEADRSSAPEALASRLRRRLAGALPALTAPRFSPTLTAAMLLAAVGLTASVMLYVGPRDNGPRPSARSRYEGDAGKAEKAEKAGVESADGRDDDAPAAVESAGGSGGREPERLAVREGRGARARVAAKPAGAAAASSKGDRRALTIAAAEPDAERLVREAERKYLAAIAALSRDVGRRRRQTDAETAARFERTLAVVDRAIAETRAAARKNPRDPVAVQYMMAAYARKVDLLRDVAQD
ncbi:MAG TPA: zf-HC2 domain-containing protein [Pyrinomonadaceae bacterium]|jgi:hypothetical protein